MRAYTTALANGLAHGFRQPGRGCVEGGPGRRRRLAWGPGAVAFLVAAFIGAQDRVAPGPPPLPVTPPAAAQPVPEDPGAPAAGAPAGSVASGGFLLDPARRSLSFPARLLRPQMPLEAIVVTPRGRVHEALLETDVSPLRLQALLYALGLDNGPRRPDATGRQGDLVDIDLEYGGATGVTVREPVEAWIRDTRTGRPMARTGWVFTGSVMREGVFVAEAEGNLVINYPVAATVLDSPDPGPPDDTLHILDPERTNPAPGTVVQVVITARPARP